MLDFLLSNIYIIVIIGFAIFTAISSRSGKGQAQRRNPNGMPTFGGGPMDRNKRNDTKSDDSASEAQRRYREAQQRYETEASDYEEGQSYEAEQPAMEGPLSQRNEQNRQPVLQSGSSMRTTEQHNVELQKRLDQLNRHLDQRANANSSRMTEQSMVLRSDSTNPESIDYVEEVAAGSKLDTEQARQGIIWAEILGPPRSRQSQKAITTAYKK